MRTEPRRGRILCTLIAVVVVAMGVAGSTAYADPAADNGLSNAGGGQALTTVHPITLGEGWSCTPASPPAFFWGGAGPVFSTDQFSITTTGLAEVKVTDGFLKGDQFRIYDNGAPIGDTSSVPVANGSTCDPDTAFADPTYSHGVFRLPPGSHLISIEVITNPYGGGAAFIRIDQRAGVPTMSPVGITLVAIILLAAGIVSLRRATGRRLLP